jgi:hypothetical protein
MGGGEQRPSSSTPSTRLRVTPASGPPAHHSEMRQQVQDWRTLPYDRRPGDQSCVDSSSTCGMSSLVLTWDKGTADQ